MLHVMERSSNVEEVADRFLQGGIKAYEFDDVDVRSGMKQATMIA